MVVQKRVREVVIVVALAAIYILAAALRAHADAVAGFATRSGRRRNRARGSPIVWVSRGPGIFIGAIVANLLVGAPPGVAIVIGLGNTAEALVGVYLVRRITPS